MTTIAASVRLGCIAADRKVSSTDDEGSYTGWSYPARKLFKIGNSIFATAGNGFIALVLIEWLKTARRSRHELYRQISEDSRGEICVLELRGVAKPQYPRPTLWIWDGWGVPEQVLAEHLAIGSGAKAAGALLDRNEPPELAIRGAFAHDYFSGGQIDVEHLRAPQPKAKGVKR